MISGHVFQLCVGHSQRDKRNAFPPYLWNIDVRMLTMERRDRSHFTCEVVVETFFSPNLVACCLAQNLSELLIDLGRENQVTSVRKARRGEPQQNAGAPHPKTAFSVAALCVGERNHQVTSGRMRIFCCKRSAEHLTRVHVEYQACSCPASLVRK